jgi:arylsulfatase A-like enzyme
VFNVHTVRKEFYSYVSQLMHATDWLPTLLSAAGGNLSILPHDLDGLDQWKSISTNQASPRKQVLLEIDEVTKMAAIRDGDWKLVTGEHLGTFKCVQCP